MKFNKKRHELDFGISQPNKQKCGAKDLFLIFSPPDIVTEKFLAQQFFLFGCFVAELS